MQIYLICLGLAACFFIRRWIISVLDENEALRFALSRLQARLNEVNQQRLTATKDARLQLAESTLALIDEFRRQRYSPEALVQMLDRTLTYEAGQIEIEHVLGQHGIVVSDAPSIENK